MKKTVTRRREGVRSPFPLRVNTATFSILRSATRVAAASLVFACLLLPAPEAHAQSLDAPAQGFVSIEPYEVRQTFVVRLEAILPSADLPSSGVTAENRDDVLERVERLLTDKCPIAFDGTTIALEHERSEFVRSDAALGVVTDDREIIPASEAVLAIVYAASRPSFPESASITWDLFLGDTQSAEVTFRSPSAKQLFTVTPADPGALWSVPETTASLPQPEKLPPLTPLPRLSIPLLTIVLGFAALLLALMSRKLGERTPPAFGLLILATGITAVACWKVGRLDIVHPFEKPVPVTAEQADEITYALLINLYHAFDYRDGARIYDTLENSAHGPLLERIYLEISKSLTLEDQGGAKVRIKNVDLRRCIPTQLTTAEDPRAFRADCEWVAIGDVTHWAHTHTRLNRYTAELTIAPVEGQWKMTDLQILEEFSEVQNKDE